MRIGIDCRTYGPSYGYTGRYIEHLISYLDTHEDEHEYVLFFSDRNFGEFVSESDRLQTLKTATKKENLFDQIIFSYELYKQKFDLVLFPDSKIPFFYRGKSMIIATDFVSYFYPEKHLKGTIMRYWSNLILRYSIESASQIVALSEILKRDIIEIFDVHEDKIRVIPPMFLGASELLQHT